LNQIPAFVCLQQCDAALNGPLGSSKYFASEISMPYFLTDDTQANPDFSDWHHVDVPYCSQDLHSGQVTVPSNETWGLYFSGHLVFTSILDALDATAGLKSATEIILTGASAGGIGVWLNVGYLATRYPSARVTAVPIAGFYYYAYPYQGINHTSSTLADFQPDAWPGHYALWSSYVDRNCLNGLSTAPWACMLANYSFPYISTPSFAIEAQTDEVVLTAHDWVPADYRNDPPEFAYMGEWKNNMTIALAPLMNPANTRNGAFNPACFIHTSFSNTNPLINGLSYLDAFSNWYFNRTGPSGYKVQDTCGIECNPTCPPS
jgi:hypothetical protein